MGVAIGTLERAQMDDVRGPLFAHQAGHGGGVADVTPDQADGLGDRVPEPQPEQTGMRRAGGNDHLVDSPLA